MPTKEEIAKGHKASRRERQVQKALDGFGVPDRAGPAITWADVHPELIVRLVCAFSRVGGAVMFGGSRDGSTLQVVLYLDNDQKKVWLPASDDFEGMLHALVERAEALG